MHVVLKHNTQCTPGVCFKSYLSQWPHLNENPYVVALETLNSHLATINTRPVAR